MDQYEIPTMINLLLSSLLAALTPNGPSEREVDELCGFVSDQVTETDSGKHTRFTYQSILFRWAGVDARVDGKEETARKMQVYWKANADQLYCNELNSSIRNAHILLLAIDRNSNEFINDVVRRWHVDLNVVDKFTGGTVLDFVEQQLAQAKGTPREPALSRYRAMLLGNGARRAREISAAR